MTGSLPTTSQTDSSGRSGPAHVTVCIPTRNRPAYCLRAIRSVLSQAGCGSARLFVSDNSTDQDARQTLTETTADWAGVSILRPPPNMQMSAHWEWMLSIAIKEASSGIVLVLTDRHILRQGAMALLEQAHQHAPDDALVYKTDVLNDLHWPIRLCTTPSTGRIIRHETRQCLDSFDHFAEDHINWPRLLNCAVPVQTMRDIKCRFGSFTASIAPDYCFAFRYMSSRSSFCRLDAPLQIGYGLQSSNGMGFSTGKMPRDSKDFLSQHGGSTCPLAPAPEPQLSTNVVIHEYLASRRDRGESDPQLQRLDLYFRALEDEVVQNFSDDRQRRAILALLRDKYGYRGRPLLGGPAVLVRRCRKLARRTIDLLTLAGQSLTRTRDPIVFASIEPALDAAWRRALPELGFPSQPAGHA